MNTIMLAPGEPIRQLRKAKNKTLADVAKEVTHRGHKVTPSHLSKIENNKKQPSVPLLAALVDVLGGSMDAIYGRGTSSN